jgi:hypothetical protein
LTEWAFENNINYKILKRYNPWLRKNTLHVRPGKSYIFQIPLNTISTPTRVERDTLSVSEASDSLDGPDIREIPEEAIE